MTTFEGFVEDAVFVPLPANRGRMVDDARHLFNVRFPSFELSLVIAKEPTKLVQIQLAMGQQLMFKSAIKPGSDLTCGIAAHVAGRDIVFSTEYGDAIHINGDLLDPPIKPETRVVIKYRTTPRDVSKLVAYTSLHMREHEEIDVQIKALEEQKDALVQKKNELVQNFYKNYPV